MKSLKRKLLSLLLAMAMVLSLVPTALAAAGDYTVSVSVASTGNPTANADGSYPAGSTVTLTASVTEGYEDSDGELSYTWSGTGVTGNGSTATVSGTDTTITATCTISTGEGETLKSGEATKSVTFAAATTQPATKTLTVSPGSLTFDAGVTTPKTVEVTLTEGNDPVANATITATPSTNGVTASVSGTTNDQGKATVTVSPVSAGTGSITIGSTGFTSQTVRYEVKAQQSSGISVTLTSSPSTVNAGNTATITAKVTGAAANSFNTIAWTSSNTVVADFNTHTQTGLTGSAGTYTNTLTAKADGKTTISVVLQNSTTQIPITLTTCDVTVANGGVQLSGDPTNAYSVYLDNWDASFNGYYKNFYVTPIQNNVTIPSTQISSAYYTWTLNGKEVQASSTSASFTLNPYNHNLNYGSTSNTLTCKARITLTSGALHEPSYSWTIYTGYNNYYLASVNVTRSYNYALGNADDLNGSSILSQLTSRFSNYSNNGYYGLAYVQFRGTTHTYGTLNANTYTNYYPSSGSGNSYLGNVTFTPSSSSGRAIFPVRVFYYTAANQGGITSTDGEICFDTTGTSASSGDINYSGGIGDTVYFNAGDFADFYYSKTSGGSLSYVTFSTVSTGSGTLYCDGTRLSSGSPCYYSSSYRQNSLDSVYFTPSSTTASRGGTVRISFTASGTRGNYGYSNTISGTVVINYLNGTAKDITYTPAGNSISLNASDFTAAYKEATGSKTNPNNLTIQFQSVPSSGTLSYRSSSTSTVTLTSNNVKSYRFNTNGSGSTQISSVTYAPNGTRSDTIEYIAYSGGVARFTGKVVFNPSSASTSVIVTLTCPGSTGGAFNLAEFTKANAVVMASTSQVRFVMPTRGTLTYAGMTAGATGLTVPVNMINSVFYKPNAGVNGIDTVAFVCLDATGSQVGTGQVNVVISGNTSSSSNTGVTSISQFTDVPSNAWYATALADLVSRGIVQGTGNGKAEPRGTLNYGQALKMILLAAGYPAQAELSGNQWAANYKSLAVSNGLIDSSVNLTAPISRDAVVELAAKALKVSPVSGNSPFKDSNNGYAIALNRTNPAIIIGNEDGTFNGSSTLLRQEVWAIVYRMNQYTSMQYSTQMPDGI